MADSPDRIALPIRVHDFLLACAGRIDDDALTDARELLAMAELDRAVELVTASLVAGRIRLSADERDELLDLVDAVRCPTALVDRVVVDDATPLPRHRFTTGAMDDPTPEIGVLDAAARVIDVLPDIRSLSCVWRTTPAGAPAGPVPQRLVLIEMGPDGFAPSTAYRVEHALRRAGIRAAVEVVQAGADLSDYHGDALAMARRLSLRNGRSHEAHDNGDSSPYADPPSPRPVTTTRRRSTAGAHAEKRPTTDHSAARWQPRIAASDEVPAADAEPDPVAVRDTMVGEMVTDVTEPAPFDTPPFESQPYQSLPPEPPPFQDEVRPIQPEPPHVDVTPEAAPIEPVGLGPAADQAPMAADVAPAAMAGADPSAEADLSNRERELLRQLHEELAKREQSEPDPGAWHQDMSARRQPNPPGTEFNPAGFGQPEYNPNEFGGPAWHQSPAGAADQTAVNGIPPYGSTGG
ncbi:MAG TPA: hypothetical protein VFW65_34500 [Pseudonocardiaceae bacterium]|nr:hypothetical protein [Pseudonocardiaceae bacterium]